MSTPSGAPGTTPAGTSRITVGPDWLQEAKIPAAAWEFTRDELLGIDDFRNMIRHAREGNVGRAALSAGTGAAELGLTLAALGLSPFTGGGTLAGRIGAAGLRQTAGRTILRNAPATGIRGRLTNFMTSPNPRGLFGTRPRQALLQALRYGAGNYPFGDAEDAIGPDADSATPDGERPPVPVDWASIFEQFTGQPGPGVSVPSGLFRLYETPEEQEMLARELADLEARRAAGELALRAGWGNVQATNAAAAEKARSMVGAAGDLGAGIWTDAAARSRELASAVAAERGGFEGRAAIDLDTRGVDPWAGFMESQAPAERAFFEGRQNILAEDAEWLANLAGMQGEAYAGDLNRTANFVAFERAREHNMRVQDRINNERMIKAQMQMQAQATNAQLALAGGSGASKFMEDAMLAATMQQPGMLVAMYPGLTLEQAQSIISELIDGLNLMADIG